MTKLPPGMSAAGVHTAAEIVVFVGGKLPIRRREQREHRVLPPLLLLRCCFRRVVIANEIGSKGNYRRRVMANDNILAQ